MHARATRCLACGARCHGATCAHCGVDCPGEGAPRASEVRADCPRCFVALELTRFPEWDAGFVYCVGCHGCFVPPIDWAVMLDRIGPFGRVPGDELAAVPEAEGPRKGALSDAVACPVCRQPMNRVNLAKADSLPIDLCIMHGIWFDGAELATALRAVDREVDAIVKPPEIATRALAGDGDRLPEPSTAPFRVAASPARTPETRGVFGAVLDRLWSLL